MNQSMIKSLWLVENLNQTDINSEPPRQSGKPEVTDQKSPIGWYTIINFWYNSECCVKIANIGLGIAIQ